MSKMRKSVQRDTNLLTNEFTEVVRDKVDQNVRGQITVQLFDEKGDMIRESYTENIIFPHAQSLTALPYINVLSDSSGYEGGNQQVLNMNTVGALGRLYLTTYDGEENIEDWYVQGSTVGYKNYSAVNSGECSLTQLEDGRAKLHLVYDFATNEANGTINSLYFTPKQEIRSTPYFGAYGRGFRVGGRLTDWRSITADKRGKMLKMEWCTELKGYRYKEVTNDKVVALTGCNALYSSNYSHRSNFQDAEGNYYHFRMKTTERTTLNTLISSGDRVIQSTIIKYNDEGGKLSEETIDIHNYLKEQTDGFKDTQNCYRVVAVPLFMIDNEITYYIGYMTNNSAGTNHGWEYYVHYNVSTKQFRHYRKGTSYVDCRAFTNTTSFGMNIDMLGLTTAYYIPQYRQYWDVDKMLKNPKTKTNIRGVHYYIDNKVTAVNSNGDLVNTSTTGHLGPISSNAVIHPMFGSSPYHNMIPFIYMEDLGATMGIYSTNYANNYTALLFPMGTVTSHTKLPNPIIKTSANTMKIQYDFVFPIPAVGKYEDLSEVYPPSAKMTSGVSE